VIDLCSIVNFLLIRFRRFSKTVSSNNPKYVLCSDWQLSYLQNELCSKKRIRAFVKKDPHCTRIFDSEDRFTPDSFLQSQLELARGRP
jgi:hypothetical protein